MAETVRLQLLKAPQESTYPITAKVLKYMDTGETNLLDTVNCTPWREEEDRSDLSYSF